MLLSTITVSTLADSGAGSLRAAIATANATPGSSTINFSTAGTINLASALEPITSSVTIDGSTAPGFSTRPVVEINDAGYAGLQFNTGSVGSILRSIGVVNSSGPGVTLNDSHILLVGNNIGVTLDGTTVAPNTGDGSLINASSNTDVIGATTTLAANSPISAASNVISGNGGNGIDIVGSTGDRLIANYIGTDVAGTIALPNGQNGVELNASATANTIGGTIPFVNSQNLLPLSNLISGNAQAGVLITGASTSNTLAANFIGTNLTGNVALGNAGNGVSILGSNNNTVTGTIFSQQPFIYENVVSGNGGNGIDIQNSNNTTVQANTFGIGYNNETPIGNALDGALIEGSSANTQFGGVIPLGNVSAANGHSGVEIADTASGSIVFNTFAGLAAFEDYTNLGNRIDGMLISSTGGNNEIRTNVIANNHANGIELTGDATGVQITEAIIGLNTNGSLPMPNGASGILITGDAHGNAIGGYQPSVIRQVTISANLGNGIAITGTAHGNEVFHSYIGTALLGQAAYPNAGNGIYVGPGTYSNTIGGPSTFFTNVISGNLGNGIVLQGTTGNMIAGNVIGLQAPLNGITPDAPLPNGGGGILIINSSNNLIGGTVAGASNAIAYNSAGGIIIASGSGNAILQNSIYNNVNAGIILAPGANDNQAAPKLTAISRSPKRTRITGRLKSTANSRFTIQFFANANVLKSRASSGRTFLSSITVTTNSKGIANFSVLVPTQTVKTYFTATATNSNMSTSVFSC